VEGYDPHELRRATKHLSENTQCPDWDGKRHRLEKLLVAHLLKKLA
jgi:hypothetical protein